MPFNALGHIAYLFHNWASDSYESYDLTVDTSWVENIMCLLIFVLLCQS